MKATIAFSALLICGVIISGCYTSTHTFDIDSDAGKYMPSEKALEILRTKISAYSKPEGIIMLKRNSKQRVFVPYEQIQFEITNFNYALGLSKSYEIEMYSKNGDCWLRISTLYHKELELSNDDIMEIGTALSALGAQQLRDSNVVGNTMNEIFR